LKRINIAIDGHSSCGKGTLARQIAAALGYKFIDSGAMYRAVTLHLRRAGINPEDETTVSSILPDIHVDFAVNAETGRNDVWLNGENVEKEIRTLSVANNVRARLRKFLKYAGFWLPYSKKWAPIKAW